MEWGGSSRRKEAKTKALLGDTNKQGLKARVVIA